MNAIVIHVIKCRTLSFSGAAYVDLSTSSHIIEVNKAVTLNCSSSTFEGQGVRFFGKNESEKEIFTFIFFYLNGNCKTFGKDKIPFNFSFHCVNSSFYSLEIQNVTMDLHNLFYNCELFFNTNNSNKSIDVVIEVAGEYRLFLLKVSVWYIYQILYKWGLSPQTDKVNLPLPLVPNKEISTRVWEMCKEWGVMRTSDVNDVINDILVTFSYDFLRLSFTM